MLMLLKMSLIQNLIVQSLRNKFIELPFYVHHAQQIMISILSAMGNLTLKKYQSSFIILC